MVACKLRAVPCGVAFHSSGHQSATAGSLGSVYTRKTTWRVFIIEINAVLFEAAHVYCYVGALTTELMSPIFIAMAKGYNVE